MNHDVTASSQEHKHGIQQKFTEEKQLHCHDLHVLKAIFVFALSLQ